MSGVEVIAAERQRQMYEKGYDAAHDAGQAERLAKAAATYALPPKETRRALYPTVGSGVTMTLSVDLAKLLWPWSPNTWHPGMVVLSDGKVHKFDGGEPTDEEYRDLRIHQLAKAGALCAAAIDALQRTE